MAVRYLYATSGEYVAFVAGDGLFTPLCEWLGVVRDGDEVYNVEGLFVGFIDAEERLVRDLSFRLPKRILRPPAPMRPQRPLPPRRRLFLSPVSPPLEDVFLAARRPPTALFSLGELERLNPLEGCTLWAADGTYLGLVSRDRRAPDSIANRSGSFGSTESATSICNPFGPFGDRESPNSPFHPTSTDAPVLLRDRQFVANVAVNPAVPQRVHPAALLDWSVLG